MVAPHPPTWRLCGALLRTDPSAMALPPCPRWARWAVAVAPSFDVADPQGSPVDDALALARLQCRCCT
eukprot:10884597-Alexandrium_andersonii.AAC.1